MIKRTWDSSMSTLTASFIKDPFKIERVMVMTNSNRGFSAIKERNSKNNELIWPGFDLIRDYIHIHFICNYQEDLIRMELVMLKKKSNRGIFSYQGNVTLKLMIRSGEFFYFVRGFIHVALFWMSYANNNVKHRDLFSNQGDVILRLIIRSGQVLNSSEILSMSTFVQVCASASFRKIWEWVMLMTKSSRDFFSNQGDVTLRLMVWQCFELTWECIHINLICKFQKYPIKTVRVTPMTKSNRGYFSNQEGRGRNSNINDLIWPVFEFARDFIHVHLTYLQVPGTSN